MQYLGHQLTLLFSSSTWVQGSNSTQDWQVWSPIQLIVLGHRKALSVCLQRRPDAIFDELYQDGIRTKIYLSIFRACLPCRFKAHVHVVSDSGRMTLKYQGFDLGQSNVISVPTFKRGKGAFPPCMLKSPNTVAFSCAKTSWGVYLWPVFVM